MRTIMSILSVILISLLVYSCQNPKNDLSAVTPQNVEAQILKNAIEDQSTDFQEVKIVGSTLVYTQITDGVLDIKTYTYDGDVCVESERMYVFPDQMSALRHYRTAIEMAALYDGIEQVGNQVIYNLKEAQFKAETAGKNLKQLQQKFETEIDSAYNDVKMKTEKLKSSCKGKACSKPCSKSCGK